MTSKYPQRRVALLVSYDGTDFHGWQRQPYQSQTIQGVLEQTFSEFFQQEIQIDGASRTDAGVHAEEQLMAFTFEHPIKLEAIARAINRRLPNSIAVRNPSLVPFEFQPRFANQGKRYRYRIYVSKQRRPLLDRYATWSYHSLDLEQIVSGLHLLHGKKDFASFAATDGQHQSTIREIFYTKAKVSCLSEDVQVFEIFFGGTGFMKYMVRNLVGTLIEVGRGRWPVEQISEIIEAKDRHTAGPTAPARGLCLEKMFWHPPSV